MSEPGDTLDLLEYRRIVSEMYAAVREGGGGARTWSHWRTDRDELFATHPQSALSPEAQDSFSGLPYFPYDPAWRIEATVSRSHPTRFRSATAARAKRHSPRSAGSDSTRRDGQVSLTLLLAGRVRRRAVSAVSRWDLGNRHLRRGAVPPRHREGRRPRTRRRSDRARLQLRVSTRAVCTTTAGRARWPHPRTGWTSRFERAKGCSKLCWTARRPHDWLPATALPASRRTYGCCCLLPTACCSLRLLVALNRGGLSSPGDGLFRRLRPSDRG